METRIGGLRFRVKKVLLSLLNVDPEYQNNLSTKIVEHIIEHFNPRAVGQLVVSERSDGSFWLIDGFARKVALQKLHHIAWEARIYRGLDLQQEAKLYQEFQHRKADKADSVFKARLTADDKDAHAIVRTVVDAGFGFKRECLPPSRIDEFFPPVLRLKVVLMCPTYLERVYKKGTLPVTLSILGGSIEGMGAEIREKSRDHNVILALGALFERYGARIDRGLLVRKLRKEGFDSIIQAGTIASKTGKSKESAVLEEITRMYNKHVGNNRKLPLR